MISPKLVASSLNHAWTAAVIVATVLVVAACELPGAEPPASPATPTPAPSPAVTRLPPATVTAAATTPLAPTPAARAVATPAPDSSPEAAELSRAATPVVPGWLAARATRGAGAVATARAEATGAVVVATVLARATAEASQVVTVLRHSACITGLSPMRQYASNEVAQWTADGAHILFTFNRSVWAVTPDGARVWRLARSWGKPVSDPRFSPGWAATFDVTRDGQQVVYATCAYVPDLPRSALVGEAGAFRFDYELAAVGLDGQAPRRLTRHEAFDSYPAWSPDGRRVAFVSGRDDPALGTDGEVGLYTMAADGTDVRRLAPDLDVAWQPPAWSPDGHSIAVAAGSWDLMREGHVLLYVVRADGAGLVQLAAAVSGGAWSPDGTRLAFAQPAGAGVALYTIAPDGSDARWVTAVPRWEARYRTWPWIHTLAWSPDGSKLLYACGHRQFCVVTRDGQRVGATPLRGDRAAWSPDGARIAVTSQPEPRVYNGIVLYSAAPDGSDRLTLAWRGAGLVAAEAKDEDLATSRAACTAGFVVPAPEANPGLVQDCETLLAARAALFGELPVNWGSGSPLALWEGVTVTGAPPRVTGLDLAGLDVAGPIPPALGFLGQLRRLYLPGNRLTGAIPAELGQLGNLESLVLSNNHLTGGIPAEFGQLQNLERLWLNHNHLTGTIPASLDQLTHLGELYLADNRLTGCIPVGLKRVSDNDLGRLGLPDCEAGA